MVVRPIEIMGGESVYCINESQLQAAVDLAEQNPETAPRIQAKIEELEKEFSRKRTSRYCLYGY